MEKTKLIKLGSEWQKGEHHRIYFNNLCELFGLSYSVYKSGNISAATLDGERISNSRAKEIKFALAGAKVWYDLNSGEFCWKGISDTRDYSIEKFREEVAACRGRFVESTVYADGGADYNHHGCTCGHRRHYQTRRVGVDIPIYPDVMDASNEEPAGY